MSPRPRKPCNKFLPPFLYKNSKGYFRYRRPDNGKDYGMGKDRAKAVEAASQLNAMLLKSTDLVAHVMETDAPFNEFLDRFEKEIVPEKNYSESTLDDYRLKLIHIREAFGNMPTGGIHVKHVADFLDQYPNRQSNRYRSFISQIFRHAKAKGLVNSNPAEDTIPKKETVKRQRLTLEGYKAIWEKANAPIKNAMDLALITLQRREDIAEMKFSDIKDGFLHVIQKKTAMPLRIEVGVELKVLLSKCRDQVISPYIIHQPYKANRLLRAKKLSKESLSRGFAKAREKSGFFKEMDRESLPTFHEIRSLGAKLYEEVGINPQNLLGHKTEKMTELYLSRHEVKWVETQAGNGNIMEK